MPFLYAIEYNTKQKKKINIMYIQYKLLYLTFEAWKLQKLL